MESKLSMDRSYLVNLCALARKKAHNYEDIIDFSFNPDDREELAFQELLGVRDCLERALALAERMIKDANREKEERQ